ncbi:MAG: Histidine triad (HIT) protein [Parcubacteria group bacterium GW2011_GWA2_42_18]|nr:MAG: Histidine triad (HIT) protein [Parcubacteria group bacterium GW2011_GWA2_42_18]
MDDCVFCKIIKKGLPATIIYENEKILAFLDISPINFGHTLVIPKKHFPNIYETPDEELCAMTTVAKKIAQAIRDALVADGVNIAMNNNHAAGQLVFHSHLHVIPRFTNDGYEPWRSRKPYKENEAVSVAQKIKESLK